MRIRFKPEAEAELVEARAWYSLQRQGLDIQLMMRVEEALQRSFKHQKHTQRFMGA